MVLVRDTMEYLSLIIKAWMMEKILDGDSLDELAQKIWEMKMDPYSAALKLLEEKGLQR